MKSHTASMATDTTSSKFPVIQNVWLGSARLCGICLFAVALQRFPIHSRWQSFSELYPDLEYTGAMGSSHLHTAKQ
jgi:hypothetical protein